jgi:hypothetical protein
VGNKNGGPIVSDPPKILGAERRSNVGLGLAQALDPVAGLPLAAFFEQIDALKTL